MSPDRRRLLLNAVSNTAAFAAALAVSFVLAPIVLKALGDARYGAWSFAESFVAYLTLLDMGVAAALVRFVPRAIARDDRQELTRLYSASLLFFSMGGLLAAGIGAAFGFLVLDHFLSNPEFHNQFLELFLVLVFNFAINLPLSIYPAFLDGLNRFTLKSLIRTVVLLARVPLTLSVIQTQNRLVNLGLVIAACSIVENLFLAILVHRLLPDLRLRLQSIDRKTIKAVAVYSRDAMAAMFAGRLAFHTDAFVIAPFLGAAAITPFSLAAKLVDMSKSILRSATTTLTSTFSALEAQAANDQMRQTFLAGSRAAWYATMPLLIGLIIFGPTFLALWVGQEYASAGTPVLFALAATLPLTIAQSVASRVLYGVGQLRWFAIATLCDGICNLLLSLVLVKPLGIFGVAIGTAIPHIVFCVVVVIHVCTLLGVPKREYVRQIVGPVAVSAIPMVIWSSLLPFGKSWSTLFSSGVIGLSVYAIAVFALERARKRLNTRHDKPLATPLPLRRAG